MFKSALIDNDLTKPNERYFIYLDNIINKAKEYGFCILLPVWGQLVVSDNWMGEVFEKFVNEYICYRKSKIININICIK